MECAACHILLPDSAVYCHACGARQESVPESDEYKYAAFISYRHIPRDRGVAVAVQKAIETYRLPSGVAVNGALPYADRTLGKCFRDDDELAASDSLPDRISDALAASRTLIVVCSPDAAQSEWIAREIELFAQLHGRERIFAVLAEGESAEVMPALLRQKTFVGDDGVAETRRAEPLAADLRPSSAKRVSDEKLRIIAAVAGCAFDDLRQRAAARKRNRAVAITAAALAVAALIGAFAWFAHVNHQNALVEESLRLAYESRELLSQGDRYGAIEAALSALPASEADDSRPLVPEAQEALEDALQIDLARGSIWRAAYSIVTEHPVTMMGASEAHRLDATAIPASAFAADWQENIFAISDDAGEVNTYDMLTGRHLATCTMPSDKKPVHADAYTREIAAGCGRLVVSNRGAPSVLSCFDSRTGELLWSYEHISLSTMDLLADGQHIAGAQLVRGGGFDAAALEVETGSVDLVAHFGSEELPSAENGIQGAIGNWLGYFYLAVGDKLMYADMSEKRIVASASLAYPCVTSLEWYPGFVVAASAEPIPEEGFERNYAIEMFDEDLNLLWQRTGVFTSQLLASEQTDAFLAGEPIVGGATCGNTQIAVAVGREALLLDQATGELVASHNAAETILEAHAIETDSKEVSPMVVSCADGTVTLRAFSDGGSDNGGDSARLALPYSLRWARSYVIGEDVMVLVAPADDDSRIVAYRTDFSSLDEAKQEYTLDELLELAKTELASSGHTGSTN